MSVRSTQQLLDAARERRVSEDGRWELLVEITYSIQRLGRERAALTESLGITRGKNGGWKCACGFNDRSIEKMQVHKTLGRCRAVD